MSRKMQRNTADYISTDFKLLDHLSTSHVFPIIFTEIADIITKHRITKQSSKWLCLKNNSFFKAATITSNLSCEHTAFIYRISKEIDFDQNITFP